MREKVKFTNACLMVTSTCNENCVYCFRMLTSINFDPQKLPRLAEVLKEFGVKKVAVTGGEPTLHPELVKILDSLKAKGFIVSLTTNASKYMPELFEIIDIITLSIDSLNEEVLSQLGRNPDSLRNAKLYLTVADHKGKEVKVNTVITSRNATEKNIRELADFIATHPSVKRWKLMKFMKISQVKGLDSLEVEQETFKALVKLARNLTKETGVVVNTTSKEDPYLIVRPDGTILISQDGIDEEIARV